MWQVVISIFLTKKTGSQNFGFPFYYNIDEMSPLAALGRNDGDELCS